MFKQLLPNFLFEYLKTKKKELSVLFFYYYDYKRFKKYSSALKADSYNKASLISSITMDYHRVEKGLSLQNMKSKFGLSYIPNLIERVIFFHEKYGDHEMIKAAYNALITYQHKHNQLGIELLEIESKMDQLKSIFDNRYSFQNSILTITKKSVEEIIQKIDYASFVNSRHSTRQYSDRIVGNEIIENAISLAKKTPSVCNRQPWRVHHITGHLLDKLLQLQNGNLGFRNQITNLLVVVGDLSKMRLPIERHQIFIDGGMFSMSIINALHSFGLASCPLNWCVPNSKDLKLRKILNLDDQEEVMMYISFGYMNETFQVPASPRNNTKDIIFHVNT